MSYAMVIGKDGKKVVSVYNDTAHSKLRPVLGSPKITRASHVRYDSEREVWVAERADDGTVLCESPNRNECVEEEVRLLNKDLNKLIK